MWHALGVFTLREALKYASYDPDLEQKMHRRMRESEDVEDMEEWKRHRKERADMWTTPGMRPLAEPWDVDWPTILKDNYSDARLSALFPDDPAKRSQAKDLWGELLALNEYCVSIRKMSELSGQGSPRGEFYQSLRNELFNHFDEVFAEWAALHKTATQLGHFEHEHLDPDGGTTNIERRLRSGNMCLACKGPEAEAKYGHLAPAGYAATPLGMFEYTWLDKNGGTSRIEEELEKGRNVIVEWQDEEIRKKYAYLLRGWFKGEYLDTDGARTNAEHLSRTNAEHLSRSGRVCFHCKGYGAEIEPKYRHLAPTGNNGTSLGMLRMFEYLWLGPNKSTSRIEAELARGHNLFKQWETWEIDTKYSNLVPRFLDTLAAFENDYAPPKWSNVTFEQGLVERLRMGANVFRGRDIQVLEKYGHLMSHYRPKQTRSGTGFVDEDGWYGHSNQPDTVAAFEDEYDLSTLGTEGFERHLKRRLGRGQNILRGWNEEVMEKYGNLMAHYRPFLVSRWTNVSLDFEPETGFWALENLLRIEQSATNASGAAADED